MRMKTLLSWVLLPALCFISIWALARKQHTNAGSGGSFDYYLLSLSWAPNYCAEHTDDNSSECRHGRHTAFVLHGLWPQAKSGPPPQDCAPARPVSHQIVNHMLTYFPSAGLIQHEWSKHGVCSGLTSSDYFAKVEQAFRSLKIPEQYLNLDRQQEFSVRKIEQDFAQSNHAPQGAFRLSCHNSELVSVEACLSKELQFQSCSRSVRECPADAVLMRPPE